MLNPGRQVFRFTAILQYVYEIQVHAVFHYSIPYPDQYSKVLSLKSRVRTRKYKTILIKQIF